MSERMRCVVSECCQERGRVMVVLGDVALG